MIEVGFKCTSIKKEGYANEDLMEFVIDEDSDLASLPTDISAGSTAFAIANSKAYMLNTLGEWKEI